MTVLGQTRDEERATVVAIHVEASSKANDLAVRLAQVASYIHSTLSLEYGSTDEPSEPQLTFRHLQAEVAKKKEVLRVTTTKIGTLQVLLDTERQSCTSGPNLERESWSNFTMHIPNLVRLPKISILMMWG